jgi:membrane protease YdiL (CAAX protease family)
LRQTRNTVAGHGFPWAFFVLVVLLALPLWVIAALTGWVIPVVGLPVSALIAFCPMTAALIVAYREGGADGARALLARSVDYSRIRDRRWYLAIFLLMPAIMAIEFAVMRAMGTLPPDPHLPLELAPLLFAVFVISGLGEELGWTGYATDRLQARWPALTAALVLGTIWALWHGVSFAQTHAEPWWVFWQSVTTVGLRVLIVWVYTNAGSSVFAAILFHAMANMSELLYPNRGSGYDPFLTAIFMAIVIVAIVWLWGARTLARFRFG